ncbi:MFS transporter [uncultured Microbacterium sp.]|uniref:MFS transporter n=1 Tax=uncultured Microbacterium sp. TaxID=191216 RepID=UPI0025D7B3A9|nr:MFS transporter [uncultured Microbacterium sp.]
MAALLSLAIGSFGIGMTEFVMMGLLPQIAQDLLPELWAASQEEAIARAGILISLYALGVVIGAPTISALVARYPRHWVILGLAIALTVFNFLAVIAPTFGAVAGARLLAGLPHGAYFGMGALIAADIMGPGKRTQGIAFVLTGLTIANVVGVPAGTFLGQQLGWRLTFVVVAAVFALCAVMLAIFAPKHDGDSSRTFREELKVFRIGQVWLTLAVGAIGFGGFFAVYSYIAPVVTEVAGSPEWVVPIVLVLMGLGMTVGNLLGGRLGDIDLRRAMFTGFGILILSLVLLAFSAHIIWLLAACVFAVGLGSSMTSPLIQTRLMDVAADNQSIGAALNHSSLNVGNSLGAFLGGAVIAAGWGYIAPAWVGVALACAGVAIAYVSYAVEARGRRTVSV